MGLQQIGHGVAVGRPAWRVIPAGVLVVMLMSGCEYRHTRALWHHRWMARRVPAQGPMWYGAKRGMELVTKAVITPGAVLVDAETGDWRTESGNFQLGFSGGFQVRLCR